MSLSVAVIEERRRSPGLPFGRSKELEGAMVDDIRPLYADKMTVEERERERKIRGCYPKALMKRKGLTPDLGMGNSPEGYC
jgi:hypothetical protein